MPAIASLPTQTRRNRKLFLIGILIRLLGVAFILAGDHHSDVLHKVIVCLGVFLSVTGIGVLRYMLIAGFKKGHAERRRKQAVRTN